MKKDKKDKDPKPEIKLEKEDIQNLITIVGTHPNPTGIASQEGQVKAQLLNKLNQML